MKKTIILLLSISLLLSCIRREEEFTEIGPEPTHDDGDGDYNGDGVIDDGRFRLFNYDNKEGGTWQNYEVVFQNSDLPNLSMGCCDGATISEGDLDGDGADEVSVFQAPENGCTFRMSTYSFKSGKWRRVIDPFLFPTECEEVTGDVLKSLIVKEGDKIYVMETDFDDDNFKRHKKEVKLL